MPKKTGVRTLLVSQHVKESETLLKFSRQYFCHIFWWLWMKIISKNSVLVVSKILRLFVNILTPDDKYSLSVKRVFNATISHAIIFKSEKIFLILFCISTIYIKLGILWSKRWASDVICFWNYRLQKASLLKYVKSPLSEHLWTFNMLKGPKHLLKFRSIIFVIFS